MSIKTNSKNQIDFIAQSAGNLRGSSETTRKLSEKNLDWLAGFLDGDGNFDFRKNTNGEDSLRAIRVTQHPRDSRTLSRVKTLMGGSIKPKGKKYLIWSISTKELMLNCVSLLNGRIRLKVPGFKKACHSLNIPYIEANPKIAKHSAYLSGLTDSDGSIVFNKASNRIELNLEFSINEYSENLDFSEVIPGISPGVTRLVKKNQDVGKKFKSIRYSYNNVEHMGPLYRYFERNRLYSDFKFFRAMKIKPFLEIRHLRSSPEGSPERDMYDKFYNTFMTYLNEHKFSIPPKVE